MNIFLKKTVSILLASLIFLFLMPKVKAQSSPQITIDFAKIIEDLHPLAIGLDESAYGGQKVLANDPAEIAMIKKLNVAQIRFELKVSLGDIVCAAAGCNQAIGADTWIDAIRATGAEPIIIVPDNTNDATAILKHFNKEAAKPIKRWIVGNEPDNNGLDAVTYSDRFNHVYDAMKAIDPAVKIAGPATAWFNKQYLQTFLENSGSRVDIIDYHSYGQGGSVTKTEAELLTETQKYRQNAFELRNMLLTTPATKNRVTNIDVQVGEWNMDWDKDPKYFTQFSTVWSALALGEILESGSHALPYATKNGDLGALYETTNEPMPFYHGIGMFTGEGLFQRFGTKMVYANTNSNFLKVFASNNRKNIVVINTSPTATEFVTLSLEQVNAESIDVWRKDKESDPKGNPVQLPSPNVANNTFTYSFPPYSVTTFVVNDSNTQTPTPTVTNTPTQSVTPTVTCNLYEKGDATCDGSVDLLDFEEFRQEYTLNRQGKLDITTAKADFNKDKSIDLLDFEMFRAGYAELRGHK